MFSFFKSLWMKMVCNDLIVKVYNNPGKKYKHFLNITPKVL